ncbi:MAG: cobalt ECF transporter T component CbiQ [Acidimicrobiia bacterium]|nr:cobalt ECF transporter T component CbiQ [Acidimicrobiia bacterium]
MAVIAAVVLAILAVVHTVSRRGDETARAPSRERHDGDGRAASSATPRWLVLPQVGLSPCACGGNRRRRSFVEKTLVGASAVLRRAMFSEDSAQRRGLLQRLEPRVKLLGCLGLLVVAAFVRHIPVLLAMYAGTVALAAASGIGSGFFIKRVWLFVPVFTGIVVVPATFSFVTPGQVVVPLGSWFGSPVGLTAQGLTAAGLIVTRVAVSISLVVLLTLTTTWTRLLGALRALLVPRLFIVVLAMAYRYIFHLLSAVTDMYTARKARSAAPGPATEVSAGRRFVAAGAGALFGKAHALTEEVHQAMVARGYVGEVRALERAQLGALDVGCAALSVVTMALALGGDRLLGR